MDINIWIWRIYREIKRLIMKTYGNSFVESRELAKKLAIVTAVFAAASFIASGADSSMQLLLLAVTFALLIITLYVIIKYCRCPYCGKHILLGVLKVKICPACRRNLETGKKGKKK